MTAINNKCSLPLIQESLVFSQESWKLAAHLFAGKEGGSSGPSWFWEGQTYWKRKHHGEIRRSGWRRLKWLFRKITSVSTEGDSCPQEAKFQGGEAAFRAFLHCPGCFKGPIAQVRLKEIRGFGK